MEEAFARNVEFFFLVRAAVQVTDDHHREIGATCDKGLRVTGSIYTKTATAVSAAAARGGDMTPDTRVVPFKRPVGGDITSGALVGPYKLRKKVSVTN